METQELIDLFKKEGLEKVNENRKYTLSEEDFLYEIISGDFEATIPNSFVLAQNNSKIECDSYGSEDSTLEIIVKHIESERYLSIYGTRQSYSGTEVDGIKEVKPKQVVTTIFE